MADKTYVGFGAKEFSDSAKLDAITKVEVFNGSVSGSYGTGGANNTLRVEFPSVQTTADAQTKAQAILAKVQGYRYQPYDARLAIVDPAAELGDGVSICGDYGGIYAQTQNLNAACRSDISAPTEEEVDNEYPFQPSQDRYIERQIDDVKATIEVQNGKIALVVDGGGNIKAAEIVAAINNGSSEVKISAEHIVLDGLVTATEFNAAKARIAAIESDYITADTVDATYAKITSLNITNGNVATLNTKVANVEKIYSSTASADHIYSDNISVKTGLYIHVKGITGTKLVGSASVTIGGHVYNILTI